MFVFFVKVCCLSACGYLLSLNSFTPIGFFKETSMLKFFRDKKDTWFVKGILVLTALSFMSLFGIQGVSSLRNSNKKLAEIGTEKITVQSFLTAFDRAMTRQRALTDKPFSVGDALKAGLVRRVLDDAVSRAVSRQTVKGLNIVVTDDDVRAFIFSNPQFAGYNGAFDRNAFHEYLRKMQQSEKEYVSDLKNSLEAQKIFHAVQSVRIAPKTTTETMYRLANEKRSADIIYIRENDVKIPAKPSKEELTDLYQSLADTLVAPEYRRLSIMYLTVEDAEKNIPVTDDILKDLYEQNKESFVTEETRFVNQMLFETQADADKAAGELKKGKPFKRVAETVAGQTEEQTVLGEVVKAGLLSEIAEPVFEAGKGETVGPIKTAFGWQILQVEKITPKKETSFKQAKAKLAKDYKTARAYDVLSDTVIRIEDMLGEGQSMEDVASKNGLLIKNYAFADMAGLDENAESVGLDAEILSTAFFLEENQVSPLIENKNGYFAVRVDEIREPQTKSFEKAQKELKQIWEKNLREVKAREMSEKVKAQAEKGVKPSVIAKRNGLDFSAVKDATRQDNELSPTLTALLFLKNQGDVFSV